MSESLESDIALAFRSEHSHKMLSKLAEHYGVFEPVHTPGDAYHTAFRDGQRSVVLALLKACSQANTENLKRIMEESLNARRSTPDAFPPVPDIPDSPIPSSTFG